MRPAIRVHGLSKQYRIGTAKGAPPGQLREAISDGAKGLWNRLTGRSKNGPAGENDSRGGEFWALNDISFEVQPGEVVGIIGRNGAGKSTLLKILSRIVEPTSGRAEIRGRMGSLLEVGTGFHPELTGRDNIYLNGNILGMSRKEIGRKFDAIVEFSEIENFLDTPVKRYSSGMYVRLAFAVAAHLESELLVVDEVLAVGDAGFQQKCLGKIGDVARSGRTVLFVSHNMQAVSMLCDRALLLEQGRLTLDGPGVEVVESYLGSRADHMAQTVWDRDSAPGDDYLRLRSIRVLNEHGQVAVDQDITKPFSVEMEFWVLKPGAVADCSIHVINSQGLCLFAIGSSLDRDGTGQHTEPGLYRTTCRMPAHFFNDGRHYVSAFLVRNHRHVLVNMPEVVSFSSHDYGTARGGFTGKIIGAVRPRFPWDAERLGGVS